MEKGYVSHTMQADYRHQKEYPKLTFKPFEFPEIFV